MKLLHNTSTDVACSRHKLTDRALLQSDGVQNWIEVLAMRLAARRT
jgi:hypothetical protein